MKFTPNLADIVSVVFVLAAAACALGSYSFGLGREHVEKQAVERGCGRYVVTAEREVKFEWVDCARKEQGK